VYRLIQCRAEAEIQGIEIKPEIKGVRNDQFLQDVKILMGVILNERRARGVVDWLVCGEFCAIWFV